MPLNKVVVILGTTASGKTDLAIALAKKYHGEIVSADSRQVYRGLDIGAGKELEKYQMKDSRLKVKVIPYHLIDVVSPKTQFTVAQYQKLAYRAINNILRRGRVPIVCGGTGLYVDAVVKGYRFENREFRIQNAELGRVRKKLEKISPAELLVLLKKIDPATYKIIDKKNRRRVQRALEIFYTTKKTKSELSRATPPPYQFLKIGVTYPRPVLKKRIEKRLQQRFFEGLVGEVKKLKKSGLSWKRLEEFGLEYRWTANFLQNKISRQEYHDGLLRDINAFAKRQMTWFKRDHEILWTQSRRKIDRLIEKFLAN